MKIAKKKVRITSPLVNPIIDLERPLEKVLKKGDYIRAKAFAEQVGQFQIFLKLVVVAIQEQNNHD